jgi:hypothetical protein
LTSLFLFLRHLTYHVPSHLMSRAVEGSTTFHHVPSYL